MASIDAGDSTLQTLTVEPSIVKTVSAVIIPEAATVTIPEVSVTSLALKERVVGLVLALNETASAPTNTIRIITETGSGSTLVELALTCTS